MFIDRLRLLFFRKVLPMKHLSGVLSADAACESIEIDANFEKNKNLDWVITSWNVRCYHDDEHPSYSAPVGALTLKTLNDRALDLLDDIATSFILNTNKRVDISVARRNNCQDLWHQEIVIKREPLWHALFRWVKELPG